MFRLDQIKKKAISTGFINKFVDTTNLLTVGFCLNEIYKEIKHLKFKANKYDLLVDAVEDGGVYACSKCCYIGTKFTAEFGSNYYDYIVSIKCPICHTKIPAENIDLNKAVEKLLKKKKDK